MLYIYVSRGSDIEVIKDIDNTKIIRYDRRQGWQEPNPETLAPNDKILVLFSGRRKPIRNKAHLLGSEEGAVLARDKIKFRVHMQQHDLNIPKTWFNIEEARVPFIARPRYHTLNKNFIIIRDELSKQRLKTRLYRANRTWYFQELIEVYKEYRAMVLNNKIFLVYNRMLGDNVEDTLNIRNKARRTSSLIRYECREEVSEENLRLCVDTMKALNLAYGAVDLIVDKEGRGYVVEVNTAPLLHGELVRDALRDAIITLAEELK